FFQLLFQRLGIEMTPDVHHYLSIQHGARERRLASIKTPKFKRKRKEKFYSKLKEEVSVAQKERDVREGTYQPGIGMDGGYTADDIATADSKKKAKKKSRQCPYCQGYGHVTRRSKHCKENPLNKVGDVGTNDKDAALLEQERNEMDEMDALAFHDSSDDTFFDAKGSLTSTSSGSSTAKI
ncbi:MAG: hypothetical protein SGARI_005522, partial [Bacillariaceae sp.]